MQRIAVFNVNNIKKLREIQAALSKKDSNLFAFNMFFLKIKLNVLDKPLFGVSQFQQLLELCATNLIEVIVEADFAEYVYFTGYEVSKAKKNYFNTLVDTYKVKHVSVVSHKELDVLTILKGSMCSINLYNSNDFCSDSKQSLHVRNVISQTSECSLYAAMVPMDNIRKLVTFEKLNIKHTEGKPEEKTFAMYKATLEGEKTINPSTKLVTKPTEKPSYIEFVLINRHEDKVGAPHPYVLKKKHLPNDIQKILHNLVEIQLLPRTIRSIELP